MSRISAPMPRIERTDEPGEPDCSVSMSPAGDSYVGVDDQPADVHARAIVRSAT